MFLLDSYLTFLDIERHYHTILRHTLDTIDWNKIIPASTMNSPEIPGSKPSPLIIANKQQQNELEHMGNAAAEAASNDGDDDIVCIARTTTVATNDECPQIVNYCSPTASTSTSCPTPTITPENVNISTNANVKNNNNTNDDDDDIMCIGQRIGSAGEKYANQKRPPPSMVDNANMMAKRRCQLDQKNPHHKAAAAASLEARHPFHFLRIGDWCPAKRRRIPPHIFERDTLDGQWRFASSELLLKKPGNFKLPMLFEKLFGTTFRAHRAQADSEALLQIALAYGADFLSQMDLRYSQFP